MTWAYFKNDEVSYKTTYLDVYREWLRLNYLSRPLREHWLRLNQLSRPLCGEWLRPNYLSRPLGREWLCLNVNTNSASVVISMQ